MQSNVSKKIKIDKTFFSETYEVSIDEEKFVENIEVPKKSQESKFNIRVKKCDVYLLDEMAKHLDVSRSNLLNRIVYEILKKEVSSIKDKDTVALMALRADLDSEIDDINFPWTYTLFKSYLDEIIENLNNWNAPGEHQLFDGDKPMETNSSESFIEVLKKLNQGNKNV